MQDLAAKQEERERKAFALEGNRRQFQQRRDAEQQLRQAESAIVTARQQLAAFDARLADARQVVASLAAAQGAGTAPGLAGRARRGEMPRSQARRAHCEQIEKAGAGDFPGISVESRRAINLAAIACAEVLCLRLARTSLVGAARAAMAKREASEYYGDLAACVSIMSDIVKARNLLEAARRHHPGSGAAHRAAAHTPRAYLGDFETVPIPESLRGVGGRHAHARSQGVTAAKLPNVLAEDTWDLFKVLLR